MLYVPVAIDDFWWCKSKFSGIFSGISEVSKFMLSFHLIEFNFEFWWGGFGINSIAISRV